MPDTGWVAASGSSWLVLSAGNTVQPYQMNCFVVSINTPRVRILDSTEPRSLQYAGRYGLYLVSNHPTLGNKNAVTLERHLRFENEIIVGSETIANSNPTRYATHAWWKFPTGVTCQVRVWW